MSDSNPQEQYRHEALTFLQHNDPEIHHFGESLLLPSDEQIVSRSTIASAGQLPAPARVDHSHGHDNFVNNASYTYTTTAAGVYVLGDGLVTPLQYAGDTWATTTTNLKVPYNGLINICGRIKLTATWTNNNFEFLRRLKNSANVYLSDLSILRHNVAPLSAGAGESVSLTFAYSEYLQAGEHIAPVLVLGNTDVTVLVVLNIKYDRIVG